MYLISRIHFKGVQCSCKCEGLNINFVRCSYVPGLRPSKATFSKWGNGISFHLSQLTICNTVCEWFNMYLWFTGTWVGYILCWIEHANTLHRAPSTWFVCVWFLATYWIIIMPQNSPKYSQTRQQTIKIQRNCGVSQTFFSRWAAQGPA